MGQITQERGDAAGHDHNGREITDGRCCAAGIGQGQDRAEEDVYVTLVHIQGLEQDEDDGQHHHHRRDVVQKRGDEEHQQTEHHEAKPLAALGEVRDTDGKHLHDARLHDQVCEQLHHDEDNQNIVGVALHHTLHRNAAGAGNDGAEEKHACDQEHSGIGLCPDPGAGILFIEHDPTSRWM